MRKIIVTEFISLDGVIEDPGGAENFEHGGWTIPYWSEEISVYKKDELFHADTLLLGRITYEGFARAWPSMKDEEGFADRMNTMEKFVVSETLKNASWNNTHVLRDTVAVDQIKKIKQSDGGNILISGSGELVRSLLPLNLIDEFHLLVYPLVIGSGKELFGNRIFARLNFLDCRPFSHGVVLLSYDLNLKEIAHADT